MAFGDASHCADLFTTGIPHGAMEVQGLDHHYHYQHFKEQAMNFGKPASYLLARMLILLSAIGAPLAADTVTVTVPGTVTSSHH